MAKVTVKFMGKDYSFEPKMDWCDPANVGQGAEHFLEPTDDGFDSWDKLTPTTKLGAAGMCGLLPAFGFDNFAFTSGYRSYVPLNGASDSWHMSGEALDIWEGNTGNTWMGMPEEFKAFFKGYWEEVCFHDVGTGYHLHVGNYLGGLCNEPADQLKQVKDAASATNANRAQNGQSGTPAQTAINALGQRFGGGNTPMEHGYQVIDHTTWLLPKNKTYCEPVYPDLIYLCGGIPCSVIGKGSEKKIIQATTGVQNTNGTSPVTATGAGATNAGLGTANDPLAQNFSMFEGMTMHFEGLGCVEAVVSMGAGYNHLLGVGNHNAWSPFLKQMEEEEVYHCETLLARGQDANIAIPWDPTKVERGDVVLFDWDDNGLPGHATIYDGEGGYYSNSTKYNQVMHYEPGYGEGRQLYILKTSRA